MASLVLSGDTSGSITLSAPAVAGTTTITLPTVSGGNFVVSDSSGNVGIGTTSPGAKLEIAGTTTAVNQKITATTAAAYTTYVNSGSTFWVGKENSAGNWFGAPAYASVLYEQGAYPINFYTNSAERMRIDSSGNLLVGTTSTGLPNSNSLAMLVSLGAIVYSHVNGTASGTNYTYFSYNGTQIGSITQNGTTGVLYNITSDQRLKENIVDAPSALAKIDSVKVRSFDFKSDGSHVEFGTIAQELYEVAPECVAKGDDGEEIENTWGVDTSVLVPAMIKAIQEQQTIINDLKARIETLESK